MVASRIRPKGGVSAPFGLCTFALALLPGQIGTQDFGGHLMHGLVAEQRQPMLASPFGAIHLATFSFPQPVGTAMPKPLDLTLVSLDPSDIDVSDPIAPASSPRGGDTITFPTVDRRHKADVLLPHYNPPDAPTETPITDLSEGDGAWTDLGAAEIATPLTPAIDMALLYFGAGSMDAPLGTLDRSQGDADALPVAPPPPSAQPAAAKDGETIAGKGDVDHHPRSPAERLGLSGKARAKAERCLANAVYFESRGEPVRGQIAVAQVVMNRVFSDFYPDNVCDVVYQNANHHLACQFTFACDGIPDIVTEPEAWRRAKRIATDMLDGKLWLTEVGKATHYHAYWVHPSWVHEMKKMYKLGVHTFYRPRAWGDGSDEPAWGDPKTTAALAKKL